MYMMPKGFFSQIFEAVVLFFVAVILIRTGIYLLSDVIVWIIVIPAVIILARALWKLYKHHKDMHDF